jgi:hypothetical protein
VLDVLTYLSILTHTYSAVYVCCAVCCAVPQLVESRMPLQGITLPNKVGKPVAVPKLPLM